MLQFAYVEDSPLVRRSVAAMIKMHYNSCEVHEYTDGAHFMEKFSVECRQPSLVLTDLSMPKKSGFEVIEWVKKYYPETPVLVVSMISKEESIIEGFNLGAKGYITKNLQPGDFFTAIDAVLNGGFYYRAEKQFTIVNGILYKEGIKMLTNKEMLTKREKEILRLIGKNKNYDQIADILSLSAATVRTHKDHISAKLKIQNFQHLAVYAIQIGLAAIEEADWQ